MSVDAKRIENCVNMPAYTRKSQALYRSQAYRPHASAWAGFWPSDDPSLSSGFCAAEDLPHTFYSDLAVRGQGIFDTDEATGRPRLMNREEALSS